MAKLPGLRPLRNVKNGVLLVRNRKTLWQMLRATVRGEYRMSVLSMMALVIAIIYILFPFDFIPDFIPVLGWADDGAVMYILIRRLLNETQRYTRYKAAERRK